MSENQQTEWKESWRDEYLRWVCGFANAEGGVLVNYKSETKVETKEKTREKLLRLVRARRDKTRALKQGMMQELPTGSSRLV